jgi:hypothetical protein
MKDFLAPSLKWKFDAPLSFAVLVNYPMTWCYIPDTSSTKCILSQPSLSQADGKIQGKSFIAVSAFNVTSTDGHNSDKRYALHNFCDNIPMSFIYL